MTPDQAKAARLFKKHLNANDPTGEKRNMGEFGEVFGRRDDRIRTTTGMYYQADGGVTLPTPMPENTDYIIHSHPLPAPGTRNHNPSDADYYMAYLTSGGTGGGRTIREPRLRTIFPAPC